MKTSIRFLRKMRGMTLKELSEKTHITAAHLSMIERDKREPSIQTLDKIARALEVDTEVFWWNSVEAPTGNEAEYDLIKAEDRKTYRGVYNDKLIYEFVTNSFSEGEDDWNRLEGLIAKILPGGDTNPFAPTAHKGDEFVYVIRGKMICEIEDSRIEMKTGDSVTIKNSMAHRFLNEGDEEVEVLMVRDRGGRI